MAKRRKAGFPAILRASGASAVSLMLLLAAVTGCGYRRPSLLKVEAVVTLDGKPVSQAEVMLVPNQSGRSVRGISDEAGRLAFSTYASGDGVPPGRYKAVISKLVPTKRATQKLETLRARPVPSADEAVEPMIELRESDYINMLPKQYATIDTTDLEVTIDRGTRRVILELVSR